MRRGASRDPKVLPEIASRSKEPRFERFLHFYRRGDAITPAVFAIRNSTEPLDAYRGYLANGLQFIDGVKRATGQSRRAIARR